MLKWFYLSRNTRDKLIILIIISLLFAPWQFNISLLICMTAALFLFRRKQVDFTTRRALEENLLLSPVSGTLQDIKKNPATTLVFSVKVGLLDGYGVFMPFYGGIISYHSHSKGGEELSVGSKSIAHAKLKIIGRTSVPKIYVRAGDNASSGVCLGFLPFGGTIKIEIPNECEVLVKKGDKLQSGQTILASF